MSKRVTRHAEVPPEAREIVEREADALRAELEALLGRDAAQVAAVVIVPRQVDADGAIFSASIRIDFVTPPPRRI